MKTLRLYVLRELSIPTLLSVFFFAGVLMIVKLFDFAIMAMRAGASADVLGELMLIVVGTVVTLSVPMAILLGTLVGVGRLSSENEVLAIRTGGVSVARVFLPVVLAAAILGGVLMYTNSTVIPRLFLRVERIVLSLRFNVINNLRPQTFHRDFGLSGGDLTLYFEERPESKAPASGASLAMNGVNLRMKIDRDALADDAEAEDEENSEERKEREKAKKEQMTEEERKAEEERAALEKAAKEKEQEREFLVFARSGEIRATGDELSGRVELTLRDGTWIPLEDRASNETTTIRFGQMDYWFATGAGERKSPLDAQPKQLTTGQLVDALREHRPTIPIIRDDRHGKRVAKDWRKWFAARNELIQRFTLPMSTVAFALIAIPLAMQIQPRAKALALLIAIALLFAYQMLNLLGASLGASGAAWTGPTPLGWTATVLLFLLPNVALGGAGAFMLWRENRR